MNVNLKEDLLKMTQSKLHYAIIDLTVLAGTVDGPYELKLNSIGEKLREIALIETELNLIPRYFPDTIPQSQQQPQQQNGGATHIE